MSRSLVGFVRGATIGVGLAVVLVPASVATLWWSSRIPSDRQIDQDFREHRVALQQLTDQLAKETPGIVGITKDKVMVGSTIDWKSPQDAGISTKRFEEYQRLIKQAGVTEVWRYQGAIYLGYRRWGMATGGWVIDFMRAPSPPNPLVSSLDSRKNRELVFGRPIYRQLAEDWYVRLLAR